MNVVFSSCPPIFYISFLAFVVVYSISLRFRRERNRMHAKMTRDRKKCFIASLKRVISKLEDENQQLRETLEQSRADEIIQSSEEKKTGDSFLSPFSRSNNQNNTSHSMLSNTSPSMFNSHFYTVGWLFRQHGCKSWDRKVLCCHPDIVCLLCKRVRQLCSNWMRDREKSSSSTTS